MNPLIKDSTGRVVYTLNSEEVKQLHELLNSHPEIVSITEPVSPGGVKNINLLESAVARQNIGLGDYIKYNNVYSNCATLVFGIARNHAFHNGNKRAALLSMIKHLHKNGLLLKSDVSNIEIYSFLTAVACNELRKYAQKYDKRLFNFAYKSKSSDSDILFMARWIQKNSIAKHDADRPLKWKYLVRKLAEFGINVDIDEKLSKITLTKTESSFFFIKNKKKMIYSYNSEVCNKQLLKEIRKDFNLTHQDGFDFQGIYDEDSFISEEIILFKKAIYKLSKN